jgi:hypothetical protein
MPRYDFPATKGTWTQVANKQAFDEFDMSHLTMDTPIAIYDPIFGKLLHTIGTTLYRHFTVSRRWTELTTNMPSNTYPGMIRQIAMLQRKNINYVMDNGTRPTMFYQIPRREDEIVVQYSTAQFRTMYGYNIAREELNRFANGTVSTITEIMAMKHANVNTAHNMFMTQLRKKMLAMMIDNLATAVPTGVDISNYEDLTEQQAKDWLVQIDRLLFELKTGTAKYNLLAQFMEVPESELQMVIPRDWYYNVLRRAFPFTYTNDVQYRAAIPTNLILIDTLGDDNLTDATGAIVPYSSDSVGMSTINWTPTSSTSPHDSKVQAVIYDKRAIGLEENLEEIAVGVRDPDQLATPVTAHFWVSGYMSTWFPVIKLTSDAKPNP